MGSRGRFISGYQNAILETCFRVLFGIPPLHCQLYKSLPTSYLPPPFWVIRWVVHGYPLGADGGCGWHDRMLHAPPLDICIHVFQERVTDVDP